MGIDLQGACSRLWWRGCVGTRAGRDSAADKSYGPSWSAQGRIRPRTSYCVTPEHLTNFRPTCRRARDLHRGERHRGTLGSWLPWPAGGGQESQCPGGVAALRALARRYADRQPDFAELRLIRMSELHPRRIVLTTDRADFRVYRRNGREIISALFLLNA